MSAQMNMLMHAPPSAPTNPSAGTSPIAPPPPVSRSWRPSLFVRLSIALNLACVAALICAVLVPAGSLRETLVYVVIVALLLDHGTLTLVGLWPRSRVLGPNLRNVHEVAKALAVTEARRDHARSGLIVLTIDDGPDPQVTPRVLDQLAAAGSHATFFVTGVAAREQPALMRRIIAEGHDVANHTELHRNDFSLLGPWRMRDEIAAAQRSVAQTSGVYPRWFRSPAGLRNPFLDRVLALEGLQLLSWTRRGYDAVDARPDRVLERLAGRDGSKLADGDILVLHDGHAARDAHGNAVMLDVLPRLLALCSERGLRATSIERALRAYCVQATEPALPGLAESRPLRLSDDLFRCTCPVASSDEPAS